MAFWNPFRGCHKFSEGCRYCYIHSGDKRRGIDTNIIEKTNQFDAPVRKNKDGTYKMKSNQVVYMCFSTDFFIEEADAFRDDCWQMMKTRFDLTFLFLTKRIERYQSCLPKDWIDMENVIIGCTCENQESVDSRLSIFKELPIKHKNIILQPLLEKVDISKYLDDIELVVVGGESNKQGRVLDYDWVLDIRKQCIEANVSFEFRQCGTNFIKDNAFYHLKTRDLMKQARKAGIDFRFVKNS